ncbi:MAG: hypothetical protein IBJ17_10095, partial [Reyranella sp.]|nr:hypothetical protein [Reyranella sp.]
MTTMQQRQDAIAPAPAGKGRWLGLLGVSTLAILVGCDWIGGGSTPVGPPPRPGADRQVAPSGSIPAPSSGRQYDAGISAVDETRSATPQIGSIVQGKGGQKAQKEAIEKEQAERDRKAREERQEREAAEKEAKAREAANPPAPRGAPPPDAGTITSTPPAAAPVPSPAPVSTTPMAPPAAPSTAAEPVQQTVSVPATPPAPVVAARPADPNKAFEPPPGWNPPGQTAVVTSPTPAPAVTPVAVTPVVATAEPAAAPVVQPAAMTAAAPAPARPANPNKAFEPPPGWTPPGQSA